MSTTEDKRRRETAKVYEVGSTYMLKVGFWNPYATTRKRQTDASKAES